MRPLNEAKSGSSLNAREVLLVGGGDEHLVELQHEVLERHLAGLAAPSRYLKASSGRLSRSRVLDQAAVGADQRAVRLEQRRRSAAPAAVRLGAIGGDLVVRGVDRHLRLDGDGGRLVAARDVEALDLHVAQHLEVVALVRAEQRVEDPAALVAQLAVEQVVGERRSRPCAFAAERLVDELRRSARGMRNSGWSLQLVTACARRCSRPRGARTTADSPVDLPPLRRSRCCP